MKIGILTFHRAHNYGAVLQCYALQEVLKGMGHDVEIIDYRQPFIERLYKVKLAKRFLLKCIIKLKTKDIWSYFLSTYVPLCKRAKHFHNFLSKNFTISKQISEDDGIFGYNAIIIGSDQVWSYYCTKRYEKIYWGQFKHDIDAKIIGYAISSSLDIANQVSDDIVKENLKSFHTLSLREKSLADYIFKHYKTRYPTSLDPTLLTNENTWSALINSKWSKRNFVAVYELRIHEREDNFVLSKAAAFAIQNNCDVIDLSEMFYSVEDFLSILKYAKVVFTSSFHAVVFSLIFNTPLYAFDLKDGKEFRYTDLLKSLDCDDLIVTNDSDTNTIPLMKKNIIQSNLKILQRESFDFLQNSLS